MIDLGKDAAGENSGVGERTSCGIYCPVSTDDHHHAENAGDRGSRKEEGITAKIIIGGAVITQEYADEIGADGYSKDAADAVKLAKSLM